MSEISLALERVKSRMVSRGLSASDIATQLGVSRTIVSEWLKNKKVPRPRMLLALGKLLELSYEELVLSNAVAEPVVAYRKHGNAKITPEDEERAKALGQSLRLLVPYLPFKRLDSPVRFIEPRNDPAYIEIAAEETRAAMGLHDPLLRFEDIIALYAQIKALLVPVLWGEKEGLGNALHVYLPDSQTTVVYLNLDVKLFDFKFWMLHEYAHAKTTGLLEQNQAEHFADTFATTVLVPRHIAQAELEIIKKTSDMGRRINRVLDVSKGLIVSPITLAKRIDGLAKEIGSDELLGTSIFRATTNFNKAFGLVSELLLGPEAPKAQDLIRVSEEVFKSPIYSALRGYIAERDSQEGIITASLGLAPADTKAVAHALRNI